MPFAALRVSADGILLFANLSSRVMMRESDLAVGRAVPQEWWSQVAAVLRTGKRAAIDWEGFPRRYQLTFVPDARHGWVDVFAIDVTRYVEAEEWARHAMSHDSLTGLPNHALFADRLE